MIIKEVETVGGAGCQAGAKETPSRKDSPTGILGMQSIINCCDRETLPMLQDLLPDGAPIFHAQKIANALYRRLQGANGQPTKKQKMGP